MGPPEPSLQAIFKYQFQLSIIEVKYDQLTLDKLRDLSILDVATRLGFSLKGLGNEGRRALCPYHDDRHPSLHFSKKKGIFKCFVCGAKGDLLKLVMDSRNCTFPEACDWLIHEFSVVVVESNTSLTNPTNKIKTDLSNSSNSCSKEKSVSSVQSVVPLDPMLVQRSLGITSVFCESLVSEGYMSPFQMQSAAGRYRLGRTKDGSVIFWEIDLHGHCHNGKIMHYLTNCHRDKARTPTWAAAELKKTGVLRSDFENPHCLFGLHLLSNTNLTNLSSNSSNSCSENKSVVCIVESEKSAVILSELLPDFVWVSCGGLQMFKPELLAPLVSHKVMIFPDTDETGDAFRQWFTVCQEAQRLYKFRYPLRISRLLEDHATMNQKQRKIDLVDYLFENSACKPLEFSVNSLRIQRANSP